MSFGISIRINYLNGMLTEACSIKGGFDVTSAEESAGRTNFF